MSSTVLQPLYYLNDTRLSLSGLRDADAVAQNSAAVTVTVCDATTRQAVPGQTWPLTLSYVTDSSGEYQAVLPAALDVVAGQRLVARVTAVSGGRQAYWEVPVLVRVRQE